MKKTITASLVFLTVSLNTFALPNPFSGALAVGKSGKNILIEISGAPAKNTFNILSGSGKSTRLNSEMVAVVKSGSDITCINVKSVNAYECKLLINAKGDVEKLVSFNTAMTTKSEGFATGGGFGDYINMTLNGEAANTVARSLVESKKTSKRTGSLLTTTLSGISISCVTTAEVAYTSTCQFSITANGNVDSRLLK